MSATVTSKAATRGKKKKTLPHKGVLSKWKRERMRVKVHMSDKMWVARRRESEEGVAYAREKKRRDGQQQQIIIVIIVLPSSYRTNTNSLEVPVQKRSPTSKSTTSLFFSHRRSCAKRRCTWNRFHRKCNLHRHAPVLANTTQCDTFGHNKKSGDCCPSQFAASLHLLFDLHSAKVCTQRKEKAAHLLTADARTHHTDSSTYL